MTRSVAFVVLLAAAPAAPAQVKKILNDFPYGVVSLAFSPDSKTLATSTSPSDGDNNSLRLWDIASSKEICCLGNYKVACGSLVFSPDGKALVCSGSDTTLHVWDVATKKIRLVLKKKRGIGGALAISRDSRLLAGGGFGDQAMVWDLRTGKELAATGPKRELDPRTDGVRFTCVAFSPDSKLLGTSNAGGGVALWDVATGEQRAALPGHSRPVYNVAFSPDGKTLYSLGRERVLFYWDVATGKARRKLDLSDQINYLTTYTALSPDGTTLAVLGQNHVRLLDLDGGRFRADVDWQYQGGHQRCVAFSPDGKLLATGSWGNKANNTVYLYNIPQPKQKARD